MSAHHYPPASAQSCSTSEPSFVNPLATSNLEMFVGVAKKTTTSRRADCSEHRQAAGASAQDLMRAALWAPNSETQPDGGGLFVRTGVAAVGLGLISGERGTANIEVAFAISLQNEL